ncbi:alpha/beta hydrolase [Sphingomonas aerolata]|uniref:alpha/beta hydrolase n=1 Tax=Sphingomonas aerolata TaxID=185951 RepID=UPI002FE2E796
MDSLHLVDPTLRPLLEMMPQISLTADILPAMRDRPSMLPPADETLATLEIYTVPGPAGAPDIDLHVFRPAGFTGDLPCIYHIHGGGYVMGKVSDYDPLLRPLVADLQCVVVSVEYRLAPETNFPGPIEDCYAGLVWTIAHADRLGIDPARLGVMGQSAGGGYAAALALMVRDRGEHALAFQHLIYPMLDDRSCTAPPHPYAGEFVWTAQSNRFGWTALLGQAPGGDAVSPYAAPARATDLGNLPPAYIATGALDLFVEEDIDYATRLIRSGVPVELHVYPGGYHAFDIFADGPVSQQARRDSHEALRRALA